MNKHGKAGWPVRLASAIKKRAAGAALLKSCIVRDCALSGLLFRGRCAQQLDGLLELQIFLGSGLSGLWRCSRVVGILVIDVTLRRHGFTAVTTFNIGSNAVALNHLARL